MKGVIFFCCVMILLIACEPGDLLELPAADPRISVIGFNEVGRPWVVIISPTTAGIRGVVPQGIPTAKVSIYEDGNFVETLTLDPRDPGRIPPTPLEYRESIFRSESNSPRAGHEYKVVVEAEGYPTATASYVQPEAVAADFTFEFRERIFQPIYVSDQNGFIRWDTSYYSNFDVSVTFTDPPGENFYDFWQTQSITENTADSKWTVSGYLGIEGGVRQDGVVLDGQLITDQIISGDRVTFKFITGYTQYTNPLYSNASPPEWFEISLRTTTKEMYKYLIQQRKAQLIEFDPYAQPYTTITNVENGLGIFGGFTPYSKKFYYKSEE